MMDFISLIVSSIWPALLLLVVIGCLITIKKIRKPEATSKIAISSASIIAIISFLIGIFGFMMFFIDGAPITIIAVISLINAVLIFAAIWSISILLIRWKRAELISRLQVAFSIIVILGLLALISPLVLNSISDYKASSTEDPSKITELYEKAKGKQDRSTLKKIASNPYTPEDILYDLLNSWKGPYPAYDIGILCSLEKNPNTPENLMLKLVDEGPGWCMLENPNISTAVLKKIVEIKTDNSEVGTKNYAIKLLEERGETLIER